MGIAALILGIIGVICCFTVVIAPLGVILTVIGLILGIVDTVKKGKTGKPKGISIAGLVVCAITFVVLIVESLMLLGLGILMLEIDNVDSNYTYNNIIETPEENTNNSTLGTLHGEETPYNDNYLLEKPNNTTVTKDEISGHSFVDKYENSLLNLNIDGTFEYYQSKYVLTDNYYEGTYKVYNGEEAIDYIANELREYGVTEQEQRELFERNNNYDVENYYCLVLINTKCIINGENTLTSIIETPYFGFYNKSLGLLNIANMKTATYVYFEKEN